MTNQLIPSDHLTELFDEIGDEHFASGLRTPMRPDAFDRSDDEKVAIIQEHFKAIMETMGLDLTDESLQGTPYRVAKMYIKEIFQGLNPENRPNIKVFPNTYGYKKMLVERNITLHSTCEHHFVPILGKAHVAYIPNKHVIGLSKLNRIVQYYGKRPQVQERLNRQIMEDLKETLQTDDVAVIIEAKHLCVSTRGIEDIQSDTVTVEYSGKFLSESYREELLRHIGRAQ